MKKPLDPSVQEKLNRIPDALDGVPNTVPGSLSSAFNFKGRKSPEIAEKVLETVCGPEDVLLEPFLGGGSFLLAALGKVKAVYASELDNYTFFAVKTLFTRLNRAKLKRLFQAVKEDCEADIQALYETRCCGQVNYIDKILFDPARGKDGYFHPRENRELREGRNVKLQKRCPVCGRKAKAFDQGDWDRLKQLETLDVSRFPTVRYLVNSRINITASTGADRYDRIFTHRNKAALLLLQDAILRLEPCLERDALELSLTAALSLARVAMYGSSTDILYHVLLEKAQDMNVWTLFEKKYRCLLLFKKNYAARQLRPGGPEAILANQDYGDFLDQQPGFQADVVYTDFPYTDQVAYLERSQLFRIWLQQFYDPSFRLTQEMLDRELVQTNADARPGKHSLTDYYQDLDRMFSHLDRAVRPKGLVFFTMKLGRAKYFKTYLEIVNLARKNGFEYASLTGLAKRDPTLRKQSAFTNTLTNEMLVVFWKLPEDQRYWYIGQENYEFLLVKQVYQYLRQAGDAQVTVSAAAELVRQDLQKRCETPVPETDLQRVLSLLHQNFRVYKGMIEIDSNRLYLDIEDSDDLYTKLYDLTPIYIRRLLTQKGRFVLDDIYFQLVHALCDGNPRTITQILEDERHQRDIEALIANYCVLRDGYYVERTGQRRPNPQAVDVSTLDGTEFELLIKELLIRKGYENVVRIGGAGDLGVDLVAVRREGGQRLHCLFQCKRWIAGVGSTPVQRLFAEQFRRNFDYAACITTAGYTPDGKKVAADLKIDVFDGTYLMQELDRYFPGEYYNRLC